MQPAGTEAAPVLAVDRPNIGVGFVLRKIVWIIALVVMAFFAIDGWFTIEIQTGAPQQAAAGATACFNIIAPYVIARAVDELTRGQVR